MLIFQGISGPSHAGRSGQSDLDGAAGQGEETEKLFSGKG
ncbi:hypothetical protein ASZ90_001470 [hydrocarbon metagenome]|uniref:Uncharacterized protein n=1 Tax=hydrocarbon metagenome TaxID=938273 RepID=A0A0W8G6D1_9ZZZZ